MTARAAAFPTPIPDAYWVVPGKLLAGEYPGAKDPAGARLKLRRFLDAGITFFLDLTEATEPLSPYAPLLEEEAAARGLSVVHHRMPVPDLATPDPATVSAILAVIEEAFAACHRVYVHCWGGIGRTGTVVGCYMVEQGMSGNRALAEIARLRKGTPDGSYASPETPEQRDRVRTWQRRTSPPASGLPDRLRGVAVGAAVGDALGMPLEFGRAIPLNRLVRTMQAGRLPAGSFTDDTEMALALADCLLARTPLDPTGLAARFVAWYQARPPDVGLHTATVLREISFGASWQSAAAAAYGANPHSAGNGSVMRCWPIALTHWDNFDALLRDSRLQSEVTHSHPDCIEACAFVNAAIYDLLAGLPPHEAIASALRRCRPSRGLAAVIEAAPSRQRIELKNSGWVRHTVESAVWGLLTTGCFEEAVVQVVNLGEDADTAGTVVGALAGAAYGLSNIPAAWQATLHGEWPQGSGDRWDAARFAGLADRLAHRPR